MTQQEYKLELDRIDREYNSRKNNLYTEYALSNNPYKVGDIISDHIGSVKVESVSVYLDIDRLPMCVYTGTTLRKDLTPSKKNEKRKVYQGNIEKCH